MSEDLKREIQRLHKCLTLNQVAIEALAGSMPPAWYTDELKSIARKMRDEMRYGQESDNSG